MRKTMRAITVLLSTGFVILFAAPAAAQGIHCGGYWGEGCMRPAARERLYDRHVPHRMPQGFGGGWTVRQRHIYHPPAAVRRPYRTYSGTIAVRRGTVFVGPDGSSFFVPAH